MSRPPRSVRVDPRVAEIRRSRSAHGADRDSLREQFPAHYRELTNPRTGKREWSVNVPIWKDGKRTREGHELQEMMMPMARAESARARTKPQQDRAAMRGPQGEHYVPAAAYEAALRAGMRDVRPRSPIGTATEGPDGMMWRYVGGDSDWWHPTGRTCLGEPVVGDGIARGLQRDPDGWPWRANEAGEWERMEVSDERNS